MILRSHFAVLLCLGMGCFMANAFYLKFKPPRSKAQAVKAIKSEAGKERYPSHIDHITQWLRNKGRKQLIVLDRKDKRVEEFIQQLIDLIEQRQSAHDRKPKKHCHKTFGSIHDPRNKRVICERYISGEQAQEKKREINLVIPISRYLSLMKYAEEGKEFERDGNRRNAKAKAKTLGFRRRPSSDTSSDEMSDAGRSRKGPTRFEIVENNGRGKRIDKETRPLLETEEDKRPDESATDSDETDNSDDKEGLWDNEDKSSNESIDSDDNKGSEVTESEEQYKRKQSAKKKRNKESDPDNYVYMQGSRMLDAVRRYNRDTRHFMPKRYQWDSGEFNHLGYYWFE